MCPNTNTNYNLVLLHLNSRSFLCVKNIYPNLETLVEVQTVGRVAHARCYQKHYCQQLLVVLEI